MHLLIVVIYQINFYWLSVVFPLVCIIALHNYIYYSLIVTSKAYFIKIHFPMKRFSEKQIRMFFFLKNVTFINFLLWQIIALFDTCSKQSILHYKICFHLYVFRNFFNKFACINPIYFSSLCIEKHNSALCKWCDFKDKWW